MSLIIVIARTGYTDMEIDVFQPDLTEREFGIAATECARGRAYSAECATIQPGDITVPYRSGSGIPLTGGEYKVIVAQSNYPRVISTGYIGDYLSHQTIYFQWNTTVVPSTAGTIKVYKDDGTVEVTAPTGITDDRDFDGNTGSHLCTIDLKLNNFYRKSSDYSVVLTGAVISGHTINATIATFSIENRYAGKEFIKNG